MTIHASKGLEFDHVTIPFLNHGHFPPRHRPEEGVGAGTSDGQDDDESRLLFVGMSRARVGLTLTWCRRLSGRSAKPAALLEVASDAVRRVGGEFAAWSRTPDAVRPSSPNQASLTLRARAVSLADIELYRRCPRRWAYSCDCPDAARADHLYASHASSLRHIARAILSQPPEQREACRGEAANAWRTMTGTDDGAPGFAAFLRARAEAIIARMCASTELHGGDFGCELEFAVAGHTMTVCADRVERLDGHAVALERFMARSPYGSDSRRLDLAALYWAGKRLAPGLPVEVSIRYLPSGECMAYVASEALLRGSARRIEEALAAMARRSIPCRPSEACHACRFLFVCPRSSPNDAEGGGPCQ